MDSCEEDFDARGDILGLGAVIGTALSIITTFMAVRSRSNSGIKQLVVTQVVFALIYASVAVYIKAKHSKDGTLSALYAVLTSLTGVSMSTSLASKTAWKKWYKRCTSLANTVVLILCVATLAIDEDYLSVKLSRNVVLGTAGVSTGMAAACVILGASTRRHKTHLAIVAMHVALSVGLYIYVATKDESLTKFSTGQTLAAASGLQALVGWLASEGDEDNNTNIQECVEISEYEVEEGRNGADTTT